uniref:Gag protease polyprotein n=1 Tax=Cucumis melo TaxID=3656 RepID=A0A9I9EHC0_CUCME
MTRTVMAVRRCRDGECNDDLSVMLYDDAMCMYTAIRVPVSLTFRVVPAWVSFGITTYLGLCGPMGHQSSMDIDMTRVTRRGPRIPIVLGVPGAPKTRVTFLRERMLHRTRQGQGQAGERPEVTLASHRGFCFRLFLFFTLTDLRCKSLLCFGFTSPYGYTVLRHSPGRMSPRRGARRGGGRGGRGASRGQPEAQPAAPAVDPNAPVTQADLAAMEQRYQDMLQAALAPFLAAQQNQAAPVQARPSFFQPLRKLNPCQFNCRPRLKTYGTLGRSHCLFQDRPAGQDQVESWEYNHTSEIHFFSSLGSIRSHS